MDWLNGRSFTTLFVDGNHENFDLLGQFPISDWNGGKVQFIRNSVIHLMRGQVYGIDGKRCFTMGGAASHDISGGILEPDDPDYKRKLNLAYNQALPFRINHISWWKEEMPSDEEYETARKNLDACGWQVDYIFSHCCPSSIQGTIRDGHYPRNRLTDFHEEVKNRCTFDYWFFGHYHDNRVLKRKYINLYERIMSADLFKGGRL